MGIIAVATAFFVVVVFFGISQSRYEQRKRVLKTIPRHMMVFDQLPKKMRPAVMNERERELNVQMTPNKWNGADPGWGVMLDSTSADQPIHYRTHIERSFAVIERGLQQKKASLY